MDKISVRRAPLRVASVDQQELGLGLMLVLLSLMMPLFFNVVSFDVMQSLDRALRLGEKTDLMVAALQLVALNSVRGIPHYVGAYFIAEAVKFRWREHNAWVVNTGLIILVLQLTYWGIGEIHKIRYDFGIPAILVSAFVVVFSKLSYQYISRFKKVQLIALLLIACQFLDVMPAARNLPVGRGETSYDIKQAAIVLEGDAVLNAMALVGFLLFLLFGLLVFSQLRDENNLRQLGVLKEQNQLIRTQNQLNEMKNRTHQEMQYLVHDLKSPLTAMQTLVGVMKMKCELEGRDQDNDYLTRIEGAVEHMSRMISEILYEEHRAPIPVQTLLRVALAQSSVADYSPFLQVDNQVPDAVVSANRILFPRVLVNLMQNSAQAIPEDRKPQIWLRVRALQRGDAHLIAFSVSDNGCGLDAQQQIDIWTRGWSGRQSSGLGLAFVQSVVERMQGQIEVHSAPGTGTTITILLPQGEESA